MSLIAGAFVRTPGSQVPRPVTEEILRRFSRNGPARVRTFEHGNVWAAKMDLGAFPEPAEFQAPDGSFTLICGEPLLIESELSGTDGREHDTAVLHRRLGNREFESLRATRGVFTMAHVPADGSRLILIADHLSIRPLYVLQRADLVLFSSQLAFLRDSFQPDLDTQGAIEFASFGYSLGRRTPLRGVSRLSPAEVLELGLGREARSRTYWDWPGEVPASKDRPKVIDEEIYEEFRRGIRLRLRSDQATTAYLSGGLDSRSIVSVLRDLGARVLTFNLSVPGTQDELFARLFSDAAGTVHTSVPRTKPVSLWQGDWSLLLRDAWNNSTRPEKADVERAGLVWSGDGGSVGVGGAVMSDQIAEHIIGGELRQAAESFAGMLPRGVLQQKRSSEFQTMLSQGVLDELHDLDHPDPLRRYLLFLLLNDQRRHLDGHFETLDLHCFEFQLPFFDFAFMKKMMMIPMERLTKHRFYHEWLRCFPPAASSVPWQTYPGHLPCSLPVPCDVPDQWSGAIPQHSARSLALGARRELRCRLASMAFPAAFPSQIVSRKRFLAAALLDQLRIRNYGYVIEFVFRLFWHTAQ